MDAPHAEPLDPGLTGSDARPVPGVDNGFVAAYRVRFDEAGPDGRARTSTLLRYAQDIAWRHAEALGFDRRWYADRGLGWVVRAVELELVEPILMGQTVRVSTAVVGHRRIWARRLGAFHAPAGTLAARVTTDWVLLDARNRIVRIPDAFGVAFANPEIGDEILRVAAGAGEPIGASLRLRVRARDIDPMGHVNNAVYLDWAEEALEAAGLPTDRLPRSARLEYVASAGPSDEVVAEVGGTEREWSVRIRREGADLVRIAGQAEGRAAG